MSQGGKINRKLRQFFNEVGVTTNCLISSFTVQSVERGVKDLRLASV